MSGAYMFAEFIDILQYCFESLLVAKYLWMYIGIGSLMGASIVRLIVRWFNA